MPDTPLVCPQSLLTSPAFSDSADYTRNNTLWPIRLTALSQSLCLGHHASVVPLEMDQVHDQRLWFLLSLPDSDTASQQRAEDLVFQIILKGAQMMPLRNVLRLTPHGADFDPWEIRDGREIGRYIPPHPSSEQTVPRHSFSI